MGAIMLVSLGAFLAWVLIKHDLTKDEKLHREEDADEEKYEEL